MRALRKIVVCFLVLGMLAPGTALAARFLVIRGGGWGHGIGMSQYGAYGMALEGSTASQIARHYYRGTTLGTKSDIPARVRVGLLQYQSEIGAKSSTLSEGGTITFTEGSDDTVIARSGTGATWAVRPSRTGGMRLYRNGDPHVFDGRRVFGDRQTPLAMHFEEHRSLALVVDTGRRYKHGVLRFGTHPTTACGGSYCVRLVLSVPMEQYIYGLGEMPSSWHREALKVQAMAGRTYAYRKIKSSGQHRAICDCGLYDSPVDQAYVGDAKRDADADGSDDTWWSNWKAAVDGTAGKLILYDGAPINALYSSSSGGHTENSENVWGGTAYPYLRGVPDPTDDVVVNGKHINPNHSWTRVVGWSAASAALDEDFGIGTLRSIRVVKPLGVSGRATVPRSTGGGVRIEGSGATKRVSGWDVRSALGLLDTLFRIDVRYTVGERYKDRYADLKSAPRYATTRSYGVPKGASTYAGSAQNFEVGRLTWVRSSGRVLWQRGPILARYDALGREASVLGMPRTDVWGPGTYRGASYDNGRIMWSKETGARGIWGSFFRAWKRSGGLTGRLKLPTTQRVKDAAALPGGGVRQSFQDGTIYRNPTPAPTGTFFLWGAIAAKYRQIGEASSPCGYPVADMSATSTGGEAVFEGGTMRSTAAGVTVSC